MAEPKEKKRIRELTKLLLRHNQLYYNEGCPEIPDSEYDRLMRELRELESRHPDWALPDSPAGKVGAPARPGRGFPEVPHLVPMLSLDSLTDEGEVRDFHGRVLKGLELEEGAPVEYCLEPKFDGISASLVFEGGVLVRGLTRGDGSRGEEITRNLRAVRDIPGKLKARKPPRLMEIRGEVILSRSRFGKLREEQEERGEEPFRNARNAVAGSLKRISPEGLGSLHWVFFFWGIGDVRGYELPGTYSELAERIGAMGFRVSPDLARVSGVEGILAYHDDLEARRDEIDYEMDGIVAKVNDLSLQRRLGRTARAPRWALAHKFAPRRAETRVADIRVQVGRTGTLTPVALLDPVELHGVTVQRATLHNFGLLAERDVRVGDRVEIERAGDVIPEVVKVILKKRPRKSRPFEAPDSCPECGEPVTQEGAFLYCPNIDCPAQIRRRVVHLAARRALDIDRLGPRYVDQLFEAGLIRRVEDVFFLPRKKEAILALERWGEKAFENLEEELRRASRPALPRFLFALGIRHVGSKVAADLAEAFGALEALGSADATQLMEVEGVGPRVAEEVEAFFRLPANRRFLQALAKAGVEVQPMGEESAGLPLGGRVFCFTGGLRSMSRDQARERVEALGAATTSGISQRVTDVVVGEGAGSKRKKAEDLGLRILGEAEFLELLT